MVHLHVVCNTMFELNWCISFNFALKIKNCSSAENTFNKKNKHLIINGFEKISQKLIFL